MGYGVYSFVVTDRARTGSELVALTVVFPSVQIPEFFSSQIGCGDFVGICQRYPILKCPGGAGPAKSSALYPLYVEFDPKGDGVIRARSIKFVLGKNVRYEPNISRCLASSS